MRSRNPGDLITVGLGSCCFFQIEETLVPTRHLNSFVAETGNPLTNAVKAIKRCLIARKLGQEDSGTFNGFHEKPHSWRDAILSQRIKTLGWV